MSLLQRNWYAALAVSLAMPDICGKIENPSMGVRKRYANWFKSWLGEDYVMRLNGKVRVFLSGDQCYFLRCAYLHEGGEHTNKATETLKRFHFIEPPQDGGRMHKIYNSGVLLLQVDIFCGQIANAAKEWATYMRNKHHGEIPNTDKILQIYLPYTFQSLIR